MKTLISLLLCIYACAPANGQDSLKLFVDTTSTIWFRFTKEDVAEYVMYLAEKKNKSKETQPQSNDVTPESILGVVDMITSLSKLGILFATPSTYVAKNAIKANEMKAQRLKEYKKMLQNGDLTIEEYKIIVAELQKIDISK